MPQEETEAAARPFKGIETHCIGYFKSKFLERYESYEKTLSLFDSVPEVSDNTSILNRATHVFRGHPDAFSQLLSNALEDDDFLEARIIEEWSDLGLPCYFYARHKSEEEVFFDGVLFRVTCQLTDKAFSVEEASSLMGYPHPPKAMRSFERCLNRTVPGFSGFLHTFRRFNAAVETDWASLGIQAQPEAVLRLRLNDPNFFTLTGLRYASQGKDFSFYIGLRQYILQIHAHDLYQQREIEEWKKYINEKKEKAAKSTNNAYEAFSALEKPTQFVRQKFSSWSKAKKGFIYLLKELPTLGSYTLLTSAYEQIAEAKLSCVNGMTQILGDGYNDRAAIAHWAGYYHTGEIDGNSIVNISEEPEVPSYASVIPSLRTHAEELKEALDYSFSLNKDLFASAQTEFSAYSIWLAITAILISAILQFLPYLFSLTTNSAQSNTVSIVENNHSTESKIEGVESLLAGMRNSETRTLHLFETDQYAVRVFLQEGKTLANIYDKESQSNLLNADPVAIQVLQQGIRFYSEEHTITVNSSGSPTLSIDGIVKW
ncbi:MAG: hypothetical protein AAGN15_03935 [Cyanobacteria bacterium J06581_3]